MLRALAVIAVASFALAACGGESEPAATTPDDPGREVVAALVAAAADGDAETAWELLSEPSQRRAGPTLEEFERNVFPELREQLAPFARAPLPVEVSENVDGEFGLVALSRGPDAYATPLRREGDVWRVELPGPARLEVLGPPPGSRGKFVSQIGVEKHGAGGAGVAVLYLDGVTLDAESAADVDSATIYANFATKIEPGRHTAVAFSSASGEAAAIAWTFFP
ncbi:MAG TPA: hypothetical protein VFR32_10565 [Gaiellaceae bacterium]|nr:hypothetical protein [Gaiellaceae bacterium]